MSDAEKGTSEYIRWFNEISIDDIASVGGKNASLGEMYQSLTDQGILVPNGFAVTAQAYHDFLSVTGVDQKIRSILADLDTSDIENLQQRGHTVRQAILSVAMPNILQQQIITAYETLCGETIDIDVAVRSSATAEDLPDASFAGQQETMLNVRGAGVLLETCRRCFASLFTDRAISYRQERGFDHFTIGLSIGVQLMVRSDLAYSGVMFSIDTETGFPNAVLINAAYGLGENIVQGSVNPDEFYIFKSTLLKDPEYRPIIQRRLGTKEFKLIYDLGGTRMTKNVPVSLEDRRRFCIPDDDLLLLARWACVIEDHYSRKKGHACPMDIEWAKDGLTGKMYIVQARPETVQSQKIKNVLETFELKSRSQVLVTGRAVGERIAHGPVRIIDSPVGLKQFQPGEILVTDKTDPDWEPTMKKAAAIVTNRGGRTCHAAIVSRELGLPAIVGTETGTELLQTGQLVTVCCAEGDAGFVYDGLLEFEQKTVELREVGRPKTKIMMNLANPDQAFRLSFLPNDGVGLARVEFIINHSIKIHPLALLEYDQLTDIKIKEMIDEITVGYEDKPEFFVQKLAEGVAMIAAAFYPKEVILRMSDFKSNEYANLVGGKPYEPTEENPMIGFRGASRYYDDRYRAGFALECRAIHRVREVMGLHNLKVMIPFCRTVEEGRRVISEMESHGLVQGENGLEVYVMCEIPSNVIIAEQFAEVFDGFSIGSNDLTQLTLGVDRDSEIVAHLFDERNPAVKKMISEVIRKAKVANKKIGICGQAPSDYPEFAKFLIDEGIDSISLNPDTILKTTLLVAKHEAKPSIAESE